MVQVWAPEIAMCCGALIVSCSTMLNNVIVDNVHLRSLLLKLQFNFYCVSAARTIHVSLPFTG